MGAAKTTCTGVLLCAAMACNIHAQSELPLQYHHLSVPAFDLHGSGHITLQPASEEPPDACRPETSTSSFRYFQWPTPRLRAGFIWVGVEERRGSEPHSRLYVDSDCDGSLANEAPIECFHRAEKTSPRCDFFGPLEVKFPGPAGANRYHLSAAVVSAEDKTVLVLCPAGMFQGSLIVPGGTALIVVRDFSVNGLYNDVSEDSLRSDRIVISTSDGPCELNPGMYFGVEGMCFRLDMSPDGSLLRLHGSDDILSGRLLTSHDVVELAVSGPKGHFVQRPQKGVVRLPVGAYRVDRYVIERTDRGGDMWAMRASDCSAYSFALSENSTRELELGGCITSRLSIQERDGRYLFRQRLQGPRRESITITHHRTLVDMELAIRSEDGTCQEKYRLEYG